MPRDCFHWKNSTSPRPILRIDMSKLNVDVAIIGAGPAGLTAAIYTRRALLSTVVFEKRTPGGQLSETECIENFPGIDEKTTAPALMDQMRRQAVRLGTEISLDEVVRIFVEQPGSDRPQQPRRMHLVTSAGECEARTVIIASGSRPRPLPAAGADRFKGKGVSYCATCDGFFFREKRVLVVGGGDSALTEALYLTRFAAWVGVVIRHREDDPRAFRASRLLQDRARAHPGIEFLWDRTIEEIHGDAFVSSVTFRRLSTGDRESSPIDGVFVSIGHTPETGFLRGTVDLDQHGYVITNPALATNIAGVFAAGDVRAFTSRYAQAVIAAGDGAIAAIEAERYLFDHTSPPTSIS